MKNKKEKGREKKRSSKKVKVALNEDDNDEYDPSAPVETEPDRLDIDADGIANLEDDIVADYEARQRRSCCETCFLTRLFRTYDTHFLIAITFQYFNTGVKTMMTLALLDMFKNKYKLEPAYEQELQAILLLPWTPKLFYGIITDTFPICGSRKKSYIILMGMIQCAASLCIALIPFEDAEPVAALGTVIFFTGAFMDVVVDGLMVQQQRLDPVNGSEEL